METTPSFCASYEYSGWRDLFYCVDPHSWAYMGITLSIGLSIVGAAW